MKNIHIALLALVASLILGCSTTKEAYDNGERGRLLKQAAFDLNCPIQELQDEPLSKNYRTIGIRGCGKQVKYKYVSGAGWITNSASK